MKLVWANNRFEFHCQYREKHFANNAKFRWDRERKQWYSTNITRAMTLVEYADQECLDVMREMRERRESSEKNSRSSGEGEDFSRLPVPFGQSYLSFQAAGIRYALGRPSTLIADEMGLGKTIQALGVINALQEIKSVLIICPASLKINWAREAEKWLTRKVSIGIADGKTFPETDIVIANYDILNKHSALLERSWDIVIVDEAHYAKNPKAKRSKLVYQIASKAERKLFLTGTPIVNRPKELHPLISCLDPDRWNENGKGFFPFAKRYCNAHQTRFGWDFDGSSNLDELQEELRSTIMVRRLKADVLTELPPKRRQVVELPINGAVKAVKAEASALAQHQDRIAELRAVVELAKASDNPSDYESAVEELRAGERVAFEEIAQLRHDTALAKIPYMVAHLQDCLSSGKKVVFFAHHHDVVDGIMEAFSGDAVRLIGRDSQKTRQEAVDAFQLGERARLFVGSIQAAGVGLTLTASSHVVFGELDWVPGNMTQAEDRTHRIGQKNSVLVQHLVLEGSLDATMARTLVEKQAVIDQALDNETTDSRVDDIPLFPIRAATEQTTIQAIQQEANKLNGEQIDAISQGLRFLVSLDGDRAAERNERGFNKVDSCIGHSLALVEALTPKQAALGQKIVLKYHRQLGDEIIRAIRGQR